MKDYAIYMRPKGPCASKIHSGTLFGALCWSIRLLQLAEIGQYLEEFVGSPKFIISSAFPYLENEGHKIRFFPNPFLPPVRTEFVKNLAGRLTKSPVGSLEYKKKTVTVSQILQKMKKSTYVSEDVFKKIALGQWNSEKLADKWFYPRFGPDDLKSSGDLLLTTGEADKTELNFELEKYLQETDVQRNQIDRLHGSTVEGMLFFERQIFFRLGIAGLWFIIRTDDVDFLKPALRYISDTGLGGERSVGKGHFSIDFEEVEEYEIPQAENSNCFITLSLYSPVLKEIAVNSPLLNYQLINFRGRHESKFPAPGLPVHRDMIRLFAEGSVLPFKDKQDHYGRLVEAGVRERHTVWQNGLALPAFAKIGGDAHVD